MGAPGRPKQQGPTALAPQRCQRTIRVKIPDDAKDDGFEPHRTAQKTHDSGKIPDDAETMGVSPTALPKVSDSGFNP